jgi:hypothetical protein
VLAALGILLAWWFLHGARASASTLEHRVRRDVEGATIAPEPPPEQSTDPPAAVTPTTSTSPPTSPAPAPAATTPPQVTTPTPSVTDVGTPPTDPTPVEPAPSPPSTGVAAAPDAAPPSEPASPPPPTAEPAPPLTTDPTTIAPCEATPAPAGTDGVSGGVARDLARDLVQGLGTSACSDGAPPALVVGIPNAEPPPVVRSDDRARADDDPAQPALGTDLRTPSARAEPAPQAGATDGTAAGPTSSGPPVPNDPVRTPRPQPDQPALLGAMSAGATQLHQEIDRTVPAAMTSTPCVGTSTYQRLHLEAERYLTTELHDRTARPD